jgi:hypothetical protein
VYSTRWTQHLRQGDVFGRIPYPKFKGAPQQSQRPAGWAAGAKVSEYLEYPVDQRFAVIVSHDCEFTADRRPHFLVARVQDFSPRISEEQRAAIRAANDAVREKPEAPERFDYIDTFVLEPLSGCFEDNQLVSFTTITALPMSMSGTVLDLKQAELEHEDRVRLRKKLGFFLGRDGDDVPDQDKTDAPESQESDGE